MVKLSLAEICQTTRIEDNEDRDKWREAVEESHSWTVKTSRTKKEMYSFILNWMLD